MTNQLWTSASEDFSLVVHGYSIRDSRWPAPRLRCLYWPDGTVCWEVNIYLVALRKRGLATSTVNTYCSELSVVLRFLWHQNIPILDVTDDVLIAFSIAQAKKRGKKSSSTNQINRQTIRAILFLEWLQHRLPVGKLVGKDGDDAQVTVGTGRRGSRPNWLAGTHHAALLPRSVPRSVRPVSEAVITQLMHFATISCKHPFVVQRNVAILKMLADSGIRREELVWIRKEDIKNALKSGGGLTIRTSKRHGNPKRIVPVPLVTLRAIDSFIEIQRALRLRRRRKRVSSSSDQGWAFCTISGGQLSPASVTQILGDIRVAAGISSRATAHMFRHRWITLQVIQGLKAVSAGNGLSLELLTTFLTRLASVTGHSSIESLWTYVDLAFNDSLTVPPILPQSSTCELSLDDLLSSTDRWIQREEALEPDSDRVTALRAVREQLRQSFGRPLPSESVAIHSLRQ